MDADRREEFLAQYGRSRIDGDVEALGRFLAEDLILEDPQLPFGVGDRDLFLRLTSELSAGIHELSVRRHGPVCVSADGSCFTQRWFADGALVEDPTARVSFETAEIYYASGPELSRIAIFVRDMTQAHGGLPEERGRTD
jgi:hypothetical protein